MAGQNGGLTKAIARSMGFNIDDAGAKDNERTKEARGFLRKRFERWVLSDDQKETEEREKKLEEARAKRMQGPPAPIHESVSVNALDAGRETKAAETQNRLYEAALALANRRRSSLLVEMEQIRQLRVKAESLDGPNASSEDRANANQARFDAFNRIRALINPFPEQLKLNALQQSGLQRINSPDILTNTQALRRLTIAAEQLAAELRARGIPVPQGLTRYR
jgi:hypothetical protein